MPDSKTGFSKPAQNTDMVDPVFEQMKKDDPVEQKFLDAVDAMSGTVEGDARADIVEPEQEEVKLDVSDEDKRNFIRSVLGSKPFAKEYKLFGDTIVIVFRTRTVSENAKLNSESVRDETWEMKKLAATIDNFKIGSDPTQALNGMDEAQLNTVFGSMAAITYSSIVKAYRSFEGLCDAIFEASLRADFWEGIAGSS